MCCHFKIRLDKYEPCACCSDCFVSYDEIAKKKHFHNGIFDALRVIEQPGSSFD